MPGLPAPACAQHTRHNYLHTGWAWFAPQAALSVNTQYRILPSSPQKSSANASLDLTPARRARSCRTCTGPKVEHPHVLVLCPDLTHSPAHGIPPRLHSCGVLHLLECPAGHGHICLNCHVVQGVPHVVVALRLAHTRYFMLGTRGCFHLCATNMSCRANIGLASRLSWLAGAPWCSKAAVARRFYLRWLCCCVCW